MNLVSIITPVFNAEKYLPETIESVLKQTYTDWELLLVDDCSSDSSARIIDEYVRQDERIKYLKNEKNLGPALSRDRAVQVAKGRFIAFLDSDDVWMPIKLERQISAMKESNYAFTYTRFRRMTEDGSRFGHLLEAPKSLSEFEFMKNTAIGTSTVVIDKSLVGSFEVKKVPCDDHFLWIEILRRGFTAYLVNEELVHYRVVTSSFSRNKLKYARKVWDTYCLLNYGKVKTVWYFMNYAFRAIVKYRKL